MNEKNWLGSRTDAQGMMLHFRGTSLARTKRGRRKLRLFAVGCCRQLWEHLRDEQLRQAIEVAERFADGRATKHELDAARLGVAPLNTSSYHSSVGHGTREGTAASMIEWSSIPAAYDAAFTVTCFALPFGGYLGDTAFEHALKCDLVRDIFGNPFRPVAFDPAWRTSDAVALARSMYDSRNFGAMPILADALQDAGCDNTDILNHCRDTAQVHVRGCWVVDMVLEK